MTEFAQLNILNFLQRQHASSVGHLVTCPCIVMALRAHIYPSSTSAHKLAVQIRPSPHGLRSKQETRNNLANFEPICYTNWRHLQHMANRMGTEERDLVIN